MGEHRGFLATKNPNGSWKSWAWDPHEQRYRRKSPFPTEAAALKHGKEEHSRFVARVDSLRRTKTRVIVDDYLDWLENTKKRSPSHVRNVKRCLLGNDKARGLVAVLPDPAQGDARQRVEAWLNELDMKARTKVQYLVTAKTLFNWAIPRKYITEHPIALAETEEPDDYLKAQFTVDELRKIVGAWDDPLHLLVCLMAYAGLRYEEAAFLRWEDIAGGMVMVRLDTGARVKRRKERMAPVMPELAAILDAVRPTEAKGRIWQGSTANPSRHFDAFLVRLKIARGERTQHSLRHCYAGLMTATGVPSLLLRAYMGHTSEATTAGYSQLAALYAQEVREWPRGELRFLHGAHTALWSTWPRR